MSAILVSPPNLKVVAANVSVIVAAFSGILLTYRSFSTVTIVVII